MARRKRTSRALPKAEQRIASIKSINIKLDLGNGYSVAAYEAKANSVRKQLEAYNTLLSKLDEAANELNTADKALAEMNERMLLGVAMKYGKKSNEYEMAGGRRRGERRRTRSTNQSPANQSPANQPPSTQPQPPNDGTPTPEMATA